MSESSFRFDDGTVVSWLNESDDAPQAPFQRLAALAAAVLAAEGAAGGALDITFVSAEDIEALNYEHMGADGPTDVLSFPIDPFPSPDEGSPDEASPDEASADQPHHHLRLIGDVVICAQIARDQAPTHAGSYHDELALLLTHSCLHICGYDHASPKERELMWNREKALLDHHWGPLSGHPWN